MPERVLPPWIRCHVGSAAAYDYEDFEPAGGGGGGGGSTIQRVWDLSTVEGQPSVPALPVGASFVEGTGIVWSIPATAPPGPVTDARNERWTPTFDLSDIIADITPGSVYEWTVGFEARCLESNGTEPASWPTAFIPELVQPQYVASGDIIGMFLQTYGQNRYPPMITPQLNDWRGGFCWSYYATTTSVTARIVDPLTDLLDINRFRFWASLLWAENVYEIEFNWAALEVRLA